MSLSTLPFVAFLPVHASLKPQGCDEKVSGALHWFQTHFAAMLQHWPNDAEHYDVLLEEMKAQPERWLLFWGDDAVMPQAPPLWQAWLGDLNTPECQVSWAYACGQLGKGKPTPRPTAAQEWLLHQNVVGPILLMKASLFVRLPQQALLAETTPEGLLHALALYAHTCEPYQQQRKETVLYELPQEVETRFKNATEGWETRITQWAKSEGYQSQFLLSKQATVNFYSKAELRLSLPSKAQAEPLVSILLPFKNKPELLKQCLESLLERAETYPNFEVLGIDNQSNDPELFALMRHYETLDERIRFLSYPHPFNYSAINNWAAKQARGEYLLLLNNDIELLSPDWLRAMLAWAELPYIGAVGATLYYPNDTVQHAGCTLGIWGSVGHTFKGLPRQSTDRWGWTSVPRNVMAVTAACLLLKTRDYWAVGGLDETHFAVAYNDIDLCLKLHQKGLRNLITPHCEAYHHESITRGKRRNPQQKKQEVYEAGVFRQRYSELLEAGDPYWSRYFCLLTEEPKLTESPDIEGAFEKAFFTRLPLGWEFRLFRKKGKILLRLRKNRT